MSDGVNWEIANTVGASALEVGGVIVGLLFVLAMLGFFDTDRRR